jgi:hypothetical protein
MRKTQDLILRGYFWDGIRKDVTKYPFMSHLSTNEGLPGEVKWPSKSDTPRVLSLGRNHGQSHCPTP